MARTRNLGNSVTDDHPELSSRRLTTRRRNVVLPSSLNPLIIPFALLYLSLNTAPSVPYSPTLETLDSVPTLYTCSTLQHSIHLRLLSTEENSFRLAEVFLLFS